MTPPRGIDNSEHDESSDEVDLSALTVGIDAAADSDDAAVGDAVVGIVEFVEDDKNFPTFENEIVEAPPTDHVDNVDADFVADRDYSAVSSSQIESNEPSASPNPDGVGVESEPVKSELPSWFDSKFMAEGDSAVEDEISEGNSESDDAATDTATSSADDEPADDLRQKLAEMFDLPALSENTEQVVPDSSLESRLQQFREEPVADESAETGNGDTSSLWPEPTEAVVNEASEATLDFDPTMADEAGSDSEFVSETLAEFPSKDSVEEIETANETASQAGATFEPETQSDEEESVSVYMERLLARNRLVIGGSSASVESSPDVPAADSESDSEVTRSATQSAESADAAEAVPEKWLEETPHHRQNRDQVRAEVQVLRQIANQSARSAVATASRKDVRKQVIVKTIASVLALGSGVAALLLEVSTEFGLVVLGIGMLFSSDLALTIFRNWKQLRDLRRAAAALAGQSDEDGMEDVTAAK